MRHVGDTLVWLVLILVVAAVVCFVPRLADFVSAMQGYQDRGKTAWRVTVHHHQRDYSANRTR
jgi:hypothetical protein